MVTVGGGWSMEDSQNYATWYVYELSMDTVLTRVIYQFQHCCWKAIEAAFTDKRQHRWRGQFFSPPQLISWFWRTPVGCETVHRILWALMTQHRLLHGNSFSGTVSKYDWLWALTSWSLVRVWLEGRNAIAQEIQRIKEKQDAWWQAHKNEKQHRFFWGVGMHNAYESWICITVLQNQSISSKQWFMCVYIDS